MSSENETPIAADPDANSCFLCLEPTDHFCEFCSLPYCCEDHFKVHRDQEYCYPFRIKYREEVGRYMVATRDISPLELILNDRPAVFGPNHETPPVCLECLARVDGQYLCPECQLPLCGRECYEKREYHRAECQILRETPKGYRTRVKFGRESVDPETPFANAPEYCCITPLRLLSLKKTDPALWRRIGLLMDHEEHRVKDDENYWRVFQVNVVDFLIKICGLAYTEAEVFRAIGVLRTNAFHVEHDYMKRQDVSGRAVFPTFSFLSHSCVCNARYSIRPGTNQLSLRAQTPISCGDEISIQYISFMYGHLRRAKDIRKCWFFQCKCSRCRDPEELGSRLSALRCPECRDGDVLTTDPADLEADWRCRKCEYSQSAESVEAYCDDCDKILNNTLEHDVPRYEQLIDELSVKLQPTHYVLLTVKKFLGDLYGYAPGFTYQELDWPRVERKMHFLKEFVDAVGKVDPGFTSWRGLALYELQQPMILKANKDFNDGRIDKAEFLEVLKQISDLLKESIACLEVEDERTKEGLVAKLAKKALSNVGEILLFSSYI